MCPEKIEKFRQMLEKLAAEVRASLSESSDQTKPVALDSSIGRLSRMDAMQSQQMALALKQRQQAQLSRVERALQSIENGTYGKCRRCGGEIAEERLEVQPDAILCVKCASQGK